MSYRPVPGFEGLQQEFHDALASKRIQRGQDWTRRPLRKEGPCTAAEIVRAVAAVTTVTVEQIRGQRRDHVHCTARHLAVHCMRELRPQLTKAQIGMAVSRSGWTVDHALKRARERMLTDAGFRSMFERVNARLGFPCDG